MDSPEKLYLTCACESHALRFEKDFESPMWYVSFWKRGHNEYYGWRYRISQIWQILRKGHPYGDEIVLEREQMLELQAYVNKQLEEKKP